MRTADFFYELPEELIAQYPAESRTGSRLLAVDGISGQLRDLRFIDLPSLLRPGDLLVFNDVRVMRARLLGRKTSGARVEVLVERVLGARRFLGRVKANKPVRRGASLVLGEKKGFACPVEVTGRQGELFELAITGETAVEALMERAGTLPLPPYVRRSAEQFDEQRYQTVYARRDGAVAAPTAGLHFDEGLLARIAECGVRSASLTLYVGSGTFQPVRTEQIEDHRMHAERVSVSAELCAALVETRKCGGRVVAVGTTTVRALEAASRGGSPAPLHGDTELFIYPGFRFACVDAMITNFHLPGSTLLMLVSAFCGRDAVMAGYRHAVEARYRFFSYGDAMFLTGSNPAVEFR